MTVAPSWLTHRHPAFSALAVDWRYAWDHYTGDVIRDKMLDQYLVRKNSRETANSYAERKALVDYTPHFAALVDSLAGLMFMAEDNANRRWKDENRGGRNLGDPSDPQTPLGKLWVDATGAGVGYLTVWKALTTKLVALHYGGVFLDPANGHPRVHEIAPQRIVNWREEDGAFLDVVIEEDDYDGRTSIEQSPVFTKRYLHLTPTGWTRYSYDPKTKLDNVVETGSWRFALRDGRPSAPFTMCALPIARPVGPTLARKANAIMNFESARDYALWTGNFALLNVYLSDADFTKFLTQYGKGMNVVQNNPMVGKGADFIAPSAEPARIATEVLQDKIVAFYRTGFKEYADVATEKTATEIKQDVNSGAGSFLQLVAGALDGAENRTLYFLEQAIFPNTPELWGNARVERGNDFSPLNVEGIVEKLSLRYFGKDAAVPAGRTARIAAAKMIAQYDGVAVNDEQLEADIATRDLLSQLQNIMMLPLPAAARAAMTLKVVESMDLMGGEDPDTVQREIAAKIVEEDRRKQLEAQSFPGMTGA
jgi:hypothetical protein